MLPHPNARPIAPLQRLPGVYLFIEPDVFGDGIDAARRRREMFKEVETLLQNGGVTVLPSLEELELTGGHPQLTVSANYSVDDGTVFCGIALQLTEDVRLMRDPDRICFAVTWSQIGKFRVSAEEFWPGLAQAMRILVTLFIEDYQVANSS